MHRCNLKRRFDAVGPVIASNAVEDIVPQAAGGGPEIERVLAGTADQTIREAITAHIVLE